MAETQLMGMASLWSLRTLLLPGASEQPEGRATGRASLSHLGLTDDGPRAGEGRGHQESRERD